MVIVLIGGLVVWRVSRAIVKEAGPLMVFVRLRAHLAREQKHAGGLFDAVSCVSCMSVWVGLFAALWLAGGVIDLLWYGFAFSGVALLLEAYTKNSDTLPLVTGPAGNDKVSVRGSTTSK